jgi:hypothetical protein
LFPGGADGRAPDVPGVEGFAEGALRSAEASGDSEDTADIAFFRKIRHDH